MKYTRITYLIIALTVWTASCNMALPPETLNSCLGGNNKACKEAANNCDQYDDANACYTAGIAWLLPNSGYEYETATPDLRRASHAYYLRRACDLNQPKACQKLRTH